MSEPARPVCCSACEGIQVEQEIAEGRRCKICAGRFEFNNASPECNGLCRACASVPGNRKRARKAPGATEADAITVRVHRTADGGGVSG